MPILQANTDLYTYADGVQSLLDTAALDRTGLNERHARSALRFAYRDLPARHPWTYYYRQRILQTVASYDTGTVDFDYTGGTYERMLTLTTGTWPSWAAYGRVIIDSVHYEVEDRKSSTVVTLSETSNPGADVASGTTYTIYRNSYPLPANFGAIVKLWDVDANLPIFLIDQNSQHEALQVFYSTPGVPLHVTIRSTGKYVNGYEIIYGPPPSDIYTYDLLFQSYPRALAIDEYSTGTVSITSGTATVTGSNTTFPATCAGSIIRFGTGPTKPSGYLGSLDGADNPFVYQAVIKSRDSATGLTLEEAMPTTIATLSAVGYTISDPLDIEPQRMLTPLLRMAEGEFSRLRGEQAMMAKINYAKQSLKEAMESDEVFVNGQVARVYDPIKRATVSNDDG
jgi:hypothetical protein